MNWDGKSLFWGVLFFLSHLIKWFFPARAALPKQNLIMPNLSDLQQKQIFFSQCVARFIFDLGSKGYAVTFGEAWRSPETCALYASRGKGVLYSLHSRRLAVDLNLFIRGEPVVTNKEVADLWQSYSTESYKCCAGLYFEAPDADHFSIGDAGVK